MMMRQTIVPERKIFFAGENISFRLECSSPIPGRAVLRTNLGRAAVRRAEIIAHTEKDAPVLGMDWHDIPMEKTGHNVWHICLPLTETGNFEAKCCFVPDDGSRIRWAGGENICFKVEPSGTACGNSIYSAFVRQFGANCRLAGAPELPESIKALDQAGYTVIPPSGTFRNVISELDHIFGRLNCRILQLLPVHPVPVQYGRMGRYGSPFASLDYFNVDPALADFDEKATPLEQFCELIDAVHARRGMIFMDIPVNHTGWASKLQIEHPDYFVRKEDGTFESPGAWGVVWADLCKLNYREPKVHELMAKVFLFWCRRGVDGFRCDAGYMLPEEAWAYITSRVREEYPDTIFLLEGLGGPTDLQEKLLAEKGLNWGYSELFQNYTRDEISRYQPYMEEISHRAGTLTSFAETHDNQRLAAGGKVYARLRFLVCSLLSAGSSFGFANGAEFFAAEKIDVHGSGALNFGAEDNLNALIGKLNYLLSAHPAFFPASRTRLVQTGSGNVLAAVRENASSRVLVLLNLDCGSSSRVHWSKRESVSSGRDLLTGRQYAFGEAGENYFLDLAPGEGLCIGFDDFVIPENVSAGEPERVIAMRRDFMAKKAVLAMTGDPVLAGRCSGEDFAASPEDFVIRTSGMNPPPLVYWSAGRGDDRREVMLTSGDMLLVEDDRPFRCEFKRDGKTVFSSYSVPVSGGRQAVLAGGRKNLTEKNVVFTLLLTRYGQKTEHISAKIILLPDSTDRRISFSSGEVDESKKLVFCSNHAGGYAMFPASWGKTDSKYNAMLAANCDPRYPVDRRVLFSGLRAWLVTNDYSHEITSDCLRSFTASPGNCAKWEFMVPSGQGCLTALEIHFAMAENGNAVKYTFIRKNHTEGVMSKAGAKLILRPALEDRVNHEVTKAFTGPEKDFPRSIVSYREGFDFNRPCGVFAMRCDRGRFCSEPEWYYMCALPDEAYYGLEASTDRFSPGYFEISMGLESRAVLTACLQTGNVSPRQLKWPVENFRDSMLPEEFLLTSLRRFVVKRDELSTVLAGYPWFLDWGRDTLIVLRGLVRAGEFQRDAVNILRAFAAFERNGTIPNVIRGASEANRDTSDAPLYLVIAVRDYIESTGDERVLQLDCAGRSLKQVLCSIVDNYMAGTPNGIKMDPESKLIFSPSHFSWMDTNYPAGTPREGYPVEIQALWYAALAFLGYDKLAAEVSANIEKYFFRDPRHCSDCLHCPPGTPASLAVADDHNRSNQLLAVTLKAVKTPALVRRILADSEQLLVPGGIRTLADEKVTYLLPVVHNGRLLNDPGHPYQGRYCGPEDTARKAAYHNGTVWCWPFPAYCEALFMAGGEPVRKRALSILLSAVKYFESGAAGQLPEVADGNAPHLPGGCPAQAWSLSEFFRVYGLLKVSH
ncbi:MAG: glycogen debranching enzyme N-terminal domain-containing protein [Lentisphaeria bacterium]|nr:glycogen debranching enzyme N-terminal domain-containing protein [Lentisphaeria bacterium]